VVCEGSGTPYSAKYAADSPSPDCGTPICACRRGSRKRRTPCR
jgi:hypothetical protein